MSRFNRRNGVPLYTFRWMPPDLNYWGPRAAWTLRMGTRWETMCFAWGDL